MIWEIGDQDREPHHPNPATLRLYLHGVAVNNHYLLVSGFNSGVMRRRKDTLLIPTVVVFAACTLPSDTIAQAPAASRLPSDGWPRPVSSLQYYCINVILHLHRCQSAYLHAIPATVSLFYFYFIVMDACHVPRSDPMRIHSLISASDMFVRVRLLYSFLFRVVISALQ